MRPAPRWTGLAGKTLWDWLQLLVIPLALATVAFGLNYLASERDQHREDRRAARERAIAADARREDTLRAYLQQMSSLMLGRGLGSSRHGSDVQTLARSFTLTALRRLDPGRKAIVVRFLAQAGLIGAEFHIFERSSPILPGYGGFPKLSDVYPEPKVSLSGADLRKVPLRGAYLPGTDFNSVDLRGADLRDAYLIASRFLYADLRGADFGKAFVSYPGSAIGRETFFFDSCVTGARFAEANLDGAVLEVSGRNVDFSRALLNQADLREARLTHVKLDGASTSGTLFPPHWTATGQVKLGERASLNCPPRFLGR